MNDARGQRLFSTSVFNVRPFFFWAASSSSTNRFDFFFFLFRRFSRISFRLLLRLPRCRWLFFFPRLVKFSALRTYVAMFCLIGRRGDERSEADLLSAGGESWLCCFWLPVPFLEIALLSGRKASASRFREIDDWRLLIICHKNEFPKIVSTLICRGIWHANKFEIL